MGIRVFGTVSQQKKTATFIARLFSILKISTAGVDIYYVSDACMRELYKRSGGKDKVTNVLSFPQPENFVDPETGKEFLGEIYLAPSYIFKEAKKLNIPRDEWERKLLVHGVLHLLGFNHEKESDAVRMEKKEEDILLRLHLDQHSSPRG
ncbi:MAG: rRNA maturation RNase YbeY [Parcubacteria group bacterium]|nr:rRNA maturation RNase YbeY [Parcubacteria group bacterium]